MLEFWRHFRGIQASRRKGRCEEICASRPNSPPFPPSPHPSKLPWKLCSISRAFGASLKFLISRQEAEGGEKKFQDQKLRHFSNRMHKNFATWPPRRISLPPPQPQTLP